MTLEQREQRIAEVTSPDGVKRRWFYNQAWRMRIAPTMAEYAMADILTEGSLSYVQQAVLGRYIADFLLTGSGLVIEVDGSVHQWKAERDARRSAELQDAGFYVIRFTNDEVLYRPGWVLNEVESAVSELRR